MQRSNSPATSIGFGYSSTGLKTPYKTSDSIFVSLYISKMPMSMPQFRFPFTKKAQLPPVSTEDPASTTPASTPSLEDSTPRSHRREKSVSSIAILPRRPSREEDNNTYKLSGQFSPALPSWRSDGREVNADLILFAVVNDSGIYLPPSPVEKKSFWGKREASSAPAQEVPDTQDIGFAISRESFDSYRRSFDISARTHLSDSQRPSMQSSRSSLDAMAWGRSSLDATPNRLPSIDVTESASEDDEEGEEFRDVDLNENAQGQKKRGFLGRFVTGHAADDDFKGRARSSTATWRREHNKDAEELSAMIKGSNHLIAV
ncbi:hypothetical protein Dda_6016 [Drechslerella dactyloides]|uniref:Uncharacterized protein n=1 Tax=Drechslerella dactyloides TaxID=74499 RepID=A0AAD6NI32_DREDA|nr:hypothetical protein Dda_6016 [Drechslerella dactyloides]